MHPLVLRALLALVTATTLGIVLPAANAAVLYVPPSCNDVPPGVGPDPDDCVYTPKVSGPGVRPGDLVTEALQGAPEGECIDLATSLVYSCRDTTLPLGVGVPVTYAHAGMRTNVQDSACDALLVQWCADFQVAFMRTLVVTDGNCTVQVVCLRSQNLQARAWITDTCRGRETIIYDRTATSNDGVLAWGDAPYGLSACGPYATGTVQAFLRVTDTWTGDIVYGTASRPLLYGSTLHGVGVSPLWGACYTKGDNMPKVPGCEHEPDNWKVQDRGGKHPSLPSIA